MKDSITITRADLADSINKATGISISESNKVIQSLFATIVQALVEDENIKITNFGSFYVRHKKARLGRNPKTAEEFLISERKTVSFYPSNLLKLRINEK